MKTEGLSASKDIEIRFSEVDSMNFVWHGSYSLYFEDAREAFGAKYGLGYLFIFNNGFYDIMAVHRISGCILFQVQVYCSGNQAKSVINSQHEDACHRHGYEQFCYSAGFHSVPIVFHVLQDICR